MADLIAHLNTLTVPGAIALSGIVIAIAILIK